MSGLSQKTIFISFHHPETQPFVLPPETDQPQHLVIIVEKGVHAVLVDSPTVYAGGGTGMRTIELYVQDRASVVWGHQRGSATAFEQLITVVLEEQASFQKTFFYKVSGTGTSRYSFILVGSHAHVLLQGRMMLTGTSKQHVTAEQIHHAPDTSSTLVLRAVLDDASFLDYQGTITIEKTAVRSKAFQTQKNLVISPQAHVISIPNLQVLTHEVQCGHGSAVAQLNHDQLFYLQSRGLSYETARQCIISGFLV
jgi:Fe-S cluster assembly scaffold protein SufB